MVQITTEITFAILCLVLVLIGFIPVFAEQDIPGGSANTGPQPAGTPPPACKGGLSFSLSEPLPSEKCIQQGTLYYHFTYDGKMYYAVVEALSTYDRYYTVPYTLYLKKNNVILEIFPSQYYNFRLTVYDENRNKLGSAETTGAGIAVVEIFVSNTNDTKPKPPTDTTTTGAQSTPIIKATQKNDIVTITIQNVGDSSDIYGIKLKTINGKIKNFVKLKGWEPKRLGADSVMYQTKLSPLESDDVIKIKLKVNTKRSEIQWETFSQNSKSIVQGKIST